MRFLARFLYTPHVLHVFTLFSAQEFLRTFENLNCCKIILSYVVQLERHKQPMKISTHEFLNQEHEFHYIRTTPIAASLGFLFRGFKQ